jgi:hypothetical protein
MNGLGMKIPALLINVSIRPKRSMAALTMRSVVSGSAMLPSTTTIAGSLATSLLPIEREGLIEELDYGEED